MRARTTRSEALEAQRALLREIDDELVGLYARRRELVRRLWEFKGREGLPLVDLSQEERVLARARDRAAELGLPPEDGERLLRWVLDEGRRTLPRIAPSASR